MGSPSFSSVLARGVLAVLSFLLSAAAPRAPGNPPHRSGQFEHPHVRADAPTVRARADRLEWEGCSVPRRGTWSRRGASPARVNGFAPIGVPAHHFARRRRLRHGDVIVFADAPAIVDQAARPLFPWRVPPLDDHPRWIHPSLLQPRRSPAISSCPSRSDRRLGPIHTFRRGGNTWERSSRFDRRHVVASDGTLWVTQRSDQRVVHLVRGGPCSAIPRSRQRCVRGTLQGTMHVVRAAASSS